MFSLQSLNDVKYTAFSIHLLRNHERIANIAYSPSIIYSLGPETKLGISTLAPTGYRRAPNIISHHYKV